MPTVKLTPSTYYLSSSDYLRVSSASNMYADTSSTTYATVTNSRTSTSNYYIYIRGFNFSQVPSDAIVSDITIRLKAYHSGGNTSTIYCYDDTTQVAAAGSTTALTTSATVKEFTNTTVGWDTLKGYGSDFGIRINCRRSNRNTTAYVYIYGAEIEVTYTVPVYHDVTLTNSTSAVAAVSDIHPLEGTNVTVTTDTLAGITVTDNGTDVTSQFVQASGGTVSANPSSTFTTGFSSSSGAFYQSASTSSTSWLEYAVGHSAESPYSTSNTSNTYVKPEGSTGWINYHFDFSEIPTSATINSVSVKVYGARENATVDSSHVARFQCYSGSTAKGTLQNFTSTSNGIVTVSDVGTWTASELHDAQLRFELGYYGGRMLGITWEVSYELDGYVYTITAVVADHALVFAYASAGPTMRVKQGGAWVPVAKAFVKANGSWQQVSLDQAFDSSKKYVRG